MKQINPKTFARRDIFGLLVMCIIVPAFGQFAGDYILPWSTIDGGGGTSRGGQYVLTGTIGQPDADWRSAGNFELLGGFWPGGPLCFVQFDDFARFADYWLTADITADLDDDKDLDFADLQWLADYWLFFCPYAWPLK